MPAVLILAVTGPSPLKTVSAVELSESQETSAGLWFSSSSAAVHVISFGPKLCKT